MRIRHAGTARVRHPLILSRMTGSIGNSASWRTPRQAGDFAYFFTAQRRTLAVFGRPPRAPACAMRFIGDASQSGPGRAMPPITHRTSEPAFIVSKMVRDVAAIARELEDGIIDECVKLGVRPLAGRWTVVHLPTLTVQFIHKDATLVHRMRMSGNKWVVFVPLVTSTGWAWDGERVSGETLVLAPPGAESVVFDPAGTELAMISLPATAVPPKIALAARSAPRPHCHLVRARSSDAAALVNALLKLRTNAEFKPDMISRVVRTQTD